MPLLSRRTFLAAAAGSGLGAAGVGGYALAVEPTSVRVQRYALTPPGWTPGLRLRVAVLADIHAGMPSMPMERVHEIVALTNELKPDLVLLLGDYANTDRLLRITAEWGDVIAALTAPLGRVAILGNHEWWDDRRAQRAGKARRSPMPCSPRPISRFSRTTRSGSSRTGVPSSSSGSARSSPSGCPGIRALRASTIFRAPSPSSPTTPPPS
jgi:predicted MPP superfamily phosphohydrolase